MQLKTLIKKLQKIETKNPNAPVGVDWESFQSSEYSHLPIVEIKHELINWDYKGDQSYENKDGSESQKRVVTLRGSESK